LRRNHLATINVSILLATIALIFQKSTADLFAQWIEFDESLSHGLMIIALFFYLLLQTFKTNPPVVKISATNTLLLALLSFCWFLVASININLLEQLLLLPIMFSIILCIYGWRIAIKAAPAIAFLIFAIPIWDHLNPMLVELSTTTVMWAVEFVRIPALISGNMVTLASGSLVIADGCSGLRYFIVALALVSYIILSSITTFKQKLLLVLATIALSLFVNWLRIFIIILVADATDMQSSLVADHETFGWVLFGLVCIPLVYYSNRFPVLEPDSLGIDDVGQQNITPPAIALLATTAVALAIGPFFYHNSSSTLTAPAVGDWHALGYQQALKNNTIAMHLPNAKLAIRKDFSIGNETVTGVLIANWQDTMQENLAPYWPRQYQHNDWNLTKASTIEINSEPTAILQLSKKRAGTKVCIAIQYSVGGISSADYTITKLLQLASKLTGNNRFSATAVILTPGAQNCTEAEGTLSKALKVMKADRQSLITPNGKI
jgi:exosortase